MLQTMDGGRQVTRSRDLHTVPDPNPRYKHFERSIACFTWNNSAWIGATLDLRVTRGVPRETSLNSTDIDGSWVETYRVCPGQDAGSRLDPQLRDPR